MKSIDNLTECVARYLSNEVRKFDSEDGSVVTSGNCAADLGDILPIFLFSEKEDLLAEYLSRSVDQTPQFDDSLDIFGARYHRLYEYSDYLFGLYLLCKYRGLKYRNQVQIRVRSFERLFERDPHLRYLVPSEDTKNRDPIRHIARQIRPYEDFGMFLELKILFKSIGISFLDNIDISRELQIKNLEHGLLPIYKSGIVPGLFTTLFRRSATHKFQLHKETTNVLFGVLRDGYENDDQKSREVIKNFFNVYFRKVDETGYLFSSINHGGIDLDLTIFHLLDFIVAYTERTGDDEYLNRFLRQLIPVLESCRGETGLIRFSIYNESGKSRINIPRSASWLDSAVDISTSLYKLSAISGKTEHRVLAGSLANAVIENHSNRSGYSNTVDSRTGSVIDSRSAVKTLALVGKLFIAEKASASDLLGKGIYGLLLEDR